MKKSPSSQIQAILYALAGFTFWVIGDMFMKLATEQQGSSQEIMVIAAIGGLISIFLLTAARGKISVLRPKNYKGLCVLGSLFFLNYILWLKALAHLPLANFYTVLFLSPALVAIFAARFLKEPLDWRKALAIAAGFIGALIAINPTHLANDQGDWIGYIAVFLGVIIIATQQLALRVLSKDDSRESMAFYPRFGSLLGGCITGLFYGFAPMNDYAIAYALLTGMFGGIGWIFMAHAYKLANAATVSPFHYSQIVTGALFGYFIWHDVPTVHLLMGAILIVLSGLYIVRHTQKVQETVSAVAETSLQP